MSACRFVFEPGWRYTEHFEPQLCTAPHAAHVVSGTLHIAMMDGPGSVVTIQPGQDASSVGNECSSSSGQPSHPRPELPSLEPKNVLVAGTPPCLNSAAREPGWGGF